MTLELRLSNGDVTLVDDEDYEELTQYTWSLRKTQGNTDYVAAFIPDRTRVTRGQGVSLHRWLLNPPPGMQVDHINGNGLDNRRCNLRIATPSQNIAYRGPCKTSKSGFKGVFASGNRWVAITGKGGKTYRLGPFDTPEEAARAYDKKAKQLHKEFAWLNFP